MIFVKNVEVNRNVFRNLYYSSDKSSFAGFDIDLLCENKKYDKYEILKSMIHEIGEYHKEYKAFIKLSDILYFIRILKDNDDKVYDILMYKVNNDDEYNKYERIFLSQINNLPKSLIDLNKCILSINEHVNIIKNEGLFSKYLGYEDWDYKNKCQNMIDFSCENNILNDFNKNDFVKDYTFKKNGGEYIKLRISIKYLDEYYYIDDIEII